VAVREFNGTSDRLVVDDGIIGQLANGAFTLFILVKWLTIGVGKFPISVQNGANSVAGIADNNGTIRLALADDNEFVDSSATDIIAANTWSLAAITCTAAGATPRFHGKARGSGSWNHVNGASTFTGNTIDAAAVEFGSFNNGSFSSFWNGRLATAAVFNSALSDGQLESIETTPATATVNSLGPIALWDFNQAAVGTAVTDLTGNGADETTRSGTTVINGDDPTGWTFGTVAMASWVKAL
jgi:hypothetical protein